jgi:hypothetical protein
MGGSCGGIPGREVNNSLGESIVSESLLQRVLTVFEETQTPITIQGIAQKLDISSERAESMLLFWQRKGRIRIIEESQNCESCGISGCCPIVVDLPRSYELIQSQ